MQALNEAFQQSCSKVGKDVVARIEAFAKRQLQLLVTSDSASSSRTEELEVFLAEERDFRFSEASSWSQRHALLSAERDDLQDRLVADLRHFDTQIRAAESRLEAERAEWSKERSNLLEEYGEERHRCEDGEAALMKNKSESVGRETALEAGYASKLAALTKSCDEERQTRLETASELVELQRRLSNVEGELAVASTARDSLREQLEDQRRDLVDASERAVQVCRDDYEKQLTNLGEDSRATEDSLKLTLKDAEMRASETDDEVKQMHLQATVATELVRALREELGNAMTEAAHASGALQAMEGELSSMRDELSQERISSKARIDHIEIEKAGLLNDTRNLQHQIAESARAHENASTQLAEALEAGLRERDLQIEGCEQRCLSARESAANAIAEAKYQSQRIIDIQTALDKSEKESANQRNLWENDRSRLEEALESEATALWHNQEQYTHWRESHLASLHQTQTLLKTFSEAQVQAISKSQEESFLQSASWERDRQLCKAELATSAQKIADLEAQLGVVEHEGSSVRNLLNESQSSLSVMQAERQHDAQQVAVLQHKLKEATDAADSASKREVALAHELKEVSTCHKEERARLEKELSELKQHDADQSLQLQAGYEARVHAIEARTKTELQLEKIGVESVMRENDQLRRTIATQRQQATSGVDTLQAQLETHIAQLQQQTNEFFLEPPHASKAHSHASSPYKSPSERGSAGRILPGVFSPLSLGPAAACTSAFSEASRH